MRIAIDATALPAQLGGAGNYIVRLINGLRTLNTGDRLLVIAKENDLDRLGPWTAQVEPVAVRLGSRPARLAWEQLLLPVTLRRLRVDLLHSPHYTIPLYGVDARRVVTFHDMIFLLYPGFHQRTKVMFFSRMIRLAARLANHVIADSSATRADAIRLLRMQPEAVTTIPLAADERFAPILDPARLDAICHKYHLRRPFLLVVSTLEPRKNLGAAIETLARLRLTGVDCQLAIAGTKGWAYESMLAGMSRPELASHIRVLGFVSDDDLPALYSASAAFLYPSRYEGFGLPPLEAMACGVPVVASNRSSMPEVVGDGGVLVDPDDIDAMVTAVASLLRNPSARQEWRRRAVKRAAEFSWERTARMTYAVYERVAAATAARPSPEAA
jgi:glycosyltransferase involved in cell wall biosynthesis